MKTFLILTTGFAAAFFASTLAAETTLTNAAGLARALRRLPFETHPFELTATVTDLLVAHSNALIIAIADNSGAACVYWPPAAADHSVSAGHVLHLTGDVLAGLPKHTPRASIRGVRVLSHKTPPKPRRATIREIADGLRDWQLVTIGGLVRDVFRSETSRNFATLTLVSDGNQQRVSIPLTATQFAALTDLIGKQVEIDGFPNLNAFSYRSYGGREFHCRGIDAIRSQGNPETDPFSAPMLETLLAATVEQIAAHGRVQTHGRVLCVWGGRSALVRTDLSDVVRVDCPDGPLPVRGDTIDVTGFPQSDSYHITLTRAIWRKTASGVIRCASIRDIVADELFDDDTIEPVQKARLHGQTVRLCGTLRNLPDNRIRENVILLENGNAIIPVDIGILPDAERHYDLGALLEITGTYVMETEYWRPGLGFPQIRGFRIILNDASDIRILKRPSWMTPKLLLTAVFSLFLTLVVILIWNLSLRKYAVRKGRELFREQVGRVKADLRTEERTRLAVELHDTLAQNLTGVAMEIEAAGDLRGTAPQPMLNHLGVAAKALKSCRDELRNCLWDLRSQALDEKDMTQAVLKTLQPCVADSRLTVRLAVPRTRLLDNTAHALLRIIRELVVNAIRHGTATSVKVAGTLDRNRLLCSVSDNGCGFDSENAPGIQQGHFGLQGIRERLDALGGEMQITSTPGKGTHVRIILPIPYDEQ